MLSIQELIITQWENLKHICISILHGTDLQIWKARCYQIFENRPCQPENTLRDTFSLVQQCHLKNATNLTLFSTAKNHAIGEKIRREEKDRYLCWVDGSFSEDQRGGAAYVIKMQDELIRYELKCINNSDSPFQTETEALLIAMQAAQDLQLGDCVFYLDCELLAKALKPENRLRTIQAVDWHAYQLLVRISLIMNSNPGFNCEYVPREENRQQLINWQT